MKNIRALACLTLWCASLLAAPFFATNAVAGETKAVRVASRSAWVSWLPNGMPAKGYMVLQNSSKDAATVTSVSTPDYKNASFKQMLYGDDGPKLINIDRLTIPARGQIALAQSGYHIYLEEPTRTIVPGDNVNVTLLFSTGETLRVKLPVRTSAD